MRLARREPALLFPRARSCLLQRTPTPCWCVSATRPIWPRPATDTTWDCWPTPRWPEEGASDAWAHGRTDAWAHGCMDAWVFQADALACPHPCAALPVRLACLSRSLSNKYNDGRATEGSRVRGAARERERDRERALASERGRGREINSKAERRREGSRDEKGNQGRGVYSLLVSLSPPRFQPRPSTLYTTAVQPFPRLHGQVQRLPGQDCGFGVQRAGQEARAHTLRAGAGLVQEQVGSGRE